MELDQILLDRIKDEAARQKYAVNWNGLLPPSQLILWPEVCRRYAEEVNNIKPELAGEIHYRDLHIENLNEEISQLNKQLEKLQAFKDYVHNRLDDAGIEKDPESVHKDAGCRIGGRLDIALKSKLEVKEKPDTDSNFWKNLKWKVGAIQWDKLSMSGTAIEANPATHAICEMIVNYYINPRDAAIAERDAKIAELEKLIPKNGYYIGQHEVIYEQKQISKLESELKEAKDMIATAFGYDIPIKLKRLYEKYFQDKR